MAIHEHHSGIEATICVDGQPLQEYPTDNDEIKHSDRRVRIYQSLRTITNYVESQTDKEFTIKMALKNHYIMNCPKLLLKIYVDSLHVYSFVWLRHLYDPALGEEYVFQGPLTRGTTRQMKFAKLEITSDDAFSDQVEEDIKRVSGVGEIAVVIHRQDLGTQIHGAGNFDLSVSGAPSMVHEKALKGEAKSHIISFGEARPTAPTIHWMDNGYLDGEDYPLAIFKFKYRSKEALKALMVIPRTPEPEVAPPPPYISIYSRLTEEKKKQVIGIIEKTLQKSLAENDSIKKEVNGEINVPKRTKRPHTQTEVVDLTGDSDDEASKRPKLTD